MSGSVRTPRVKPAPPPPDASVPGKKHKPMKEAKEAMRENPVFDFEKAASSCECTGMLAAQIQNEDEAENISSLGGIHLIKPPDDGKTME